MAVPEASNEANTAARRVVDLVWNNDPAVKTFQGPRETTFASAVIEEFGRELSRTPALIQQVMAGAASAAEDLNVEPYQGLIEVLQNADDLGAKEVRFAVRDFGADRQLLVVHDGAPVTFAHVLPMTLPFLTTKSEDANQKGRFGIGLKTLARIASRLAVHCHPYHFQAEKLVLSSCEVEREIPNFYDPDKDTLLVLDLKTAFDHDGLQAWFDAWDDDGLLFLSSVVSFRWCDLDGTTLGAKTVSVGKWIKTPFGDAKNGVVEIQERSISTKTTKWRVFMGQVSVPGELARAHKAKGDFTPISFAVPDDRVETGFFIAFETRVPTNLPFSLDAQFDPSTAREELIENAWNRWLIERCASVVAAVAVGTLARSPLEAWPLIPLSTEQIGVSAERWPGKQFGEAFDKVRETVGEAELLMDGRLVTLANTAYEYEHLTELLDGKDVEALSEGKNAISPGVRDRTGRWREVLDDIGVSQKIGFDELLKSMADGYFNIKPVEWWVEAGAKVVEVHPDAQIFGAPFLLTIDGRTVSCAQEGTTSRPLVFGDAVSEFARRWRKSTMLTAVRKRVNKSATGW